MIPENKKKMLVVIVIAFGLFTVFWYGNNPVPSTYQDMPNELKIRDGQTVVFNSARIEYLYKYKMPDNSTKNILMVSGFGKPFPYEVKEGGTINLFSRYDVTLVSSQFVLLTKVIE